MAGYDDIFGGTAPDPSTLQWPWSQPPVPLGAAPPPPVTPPAQPVQLDPAGAQPAVAPTDVAALAVPPPVADAAPLAPPPEVELQQHVRDLPGVSVVDDHGTLATLGGQGIDAIAGAGGMPAQGAIGDTPYAATLTPDQHYAQTVKQYGSNPLAIPDEAERQRYLNDMAQRDPAGFAELQFRTEDAKAKEFAARRQEMANRDFEQQQRNLHDYQQAEQQARARSEQIWNDATRIASTKIDPRGGIHGLQNVAMVIGAAVGGMVQAQNGGSNAGMDALNAAINRGIEAQKANLANQREGLGIKRGLLADEYARHGDMFRAVEAVRLASYKHADDQLAFEQQNYDPAGTRGLRIAALRAGVAGQIQAGQQAIVQKDFENRLRIITADQKDRELRETALQHRQTMGLGYATLASAAADRKAAADARLDAKHSEQADKEQERDRQFSVGLPAGRIELGPDGKPAVDPDGKPIVKHGPLLNADGKPYRAASPEEHKAVDDKVGAAAELVDLYDRALALKTKVGGETAAFNSAEYQELKQLEKEITILRKKGTQGMSSDADMENLSEAGGAKDLTTFRDKTAGLQAARSRTVASLNKGLRVAKYTGPALEFPAPGATTKNTPTEDKLQSLLEKPKQSYDDAIATELKRRTVGWTQKDTEGPGQFGRSETFWRAYRDAKADVDSVWSAGAAPDQQREIARLGATARGTGKVATEAREILTKIADGAHTAKLRDLAKEALAPPPSGGASVAAPEPGPLDTLLQPLDTGVSRRWEP